MQTSGKEPSMDLSTHLWVLSIFEETNGLMLSASIGSVFSRGFMPTLPKRKGLNKALSSKRLGTGNGWERGAGRRSPLILRCNLYCQYCSECCDVIEGLGKIWSLVTGRTLLKRTWCPGVGWEPQTNLDTTSGGNFPLLGSPTSRSLAVRIGTRSASPKHRKMEQVFYAQPKHRKMAQNGTESENCGGISTVSLKITRKNISDFGEAEKAYDDLSPRVLEPEVLNLLWPSLLAHPKLQKVDESGPGCLRSSSKHLIRNNCRTALGKLPTLYVICRCLSIF